MRLRALALPLPRPFDALRPVLLPLLTCVLLLPSYRARSCERPRLGPPGLMTDLDYPLSLDAIRDFCACPDSRLLENLYVYPLRNETLVLDYNMHLRDLFRVNWTADGELVYNDSVVIASTIDECLDPNTCSDCMERLLSMTDEVVDQAQEFTNIMIDFIPCSTNSSVDDDYQDYSVTTNCSRCVLWYREWLLTAKLYGYVWVHPPCAQFCEEAELNCPNWRNTNRSDYAGLPSFRCTDPTIAHIGFPGVDLGLPEEEQSKYVPCIRPEDLTWSGESLWDLKVRIEEEDYRQAKATWTNLPPRSAADSFHTLTRTPTATSILLILWLTLR